MTRKVNIEQECGSTTEINSKQKIEAMQALVSEAIESGHTEVSIPEIISEAIISSEMDSH
ncbi:MAG: hypothetical protein HLUCCO02_05680 [Idiomarinaceae bacterium HL-53]|nr:MAG: hypothetical protein HLUCCO02_05680 [Idiomarinaceae bacterium HL-53]CUS48044.1 hypothetical protein Ga0003345_0983 [Idiomarinaceae bacterium HL-53]